MRVEDEVIVYDQHGMFSAPRVWFMLRLYGMEKVRVLQGGLPAWKSEAFATQTMAAMPQPRGAALSESEVKQFKRQEGQDGWGVVDMQRVNEVAKRNLSEPEERWSSIIIDNRSAARYKAEVPEPRPNCRSGHVATAKNLPFTEVLDESNAFKSDGELARILQERGIPLEKELIWYCGSGLTACVPLLAAHVLGAKNQKIYDGAWVEYGSFPPP